MLGTAGVLTAELQLSAPFNTPAVMASIVTLFGPSTMPPSGAVVVIGALDTFLAEGDTTSFTVNCTAEFDATAVLTVTTKVYVLAFQLATAESCS